jgi:hypothetical protein
MGGDAGQHKSCGQPDRPQNFSIRFCGKGHDRSDPN